MWPRSPLPSSRPIFALQPDVVLLGTGAKQMFPAGAIRQAFAARKVGLEVMDLGAACRTYNILVQEERRVAAVLFPSRMSVARVTAGQRTLTKKAPGKKSNPTRHSSEADRLEQKSLNYCYLRYFCCFFLVSSPGALLSTPWRRTAATC